MTTSTGPPDQTSGMNTPTSTAPTTTRTSTSTSSSRTDDSRPGGINLEKVLDPDLAVAVCDGGGILAPSYEGRLACLHEHAEDGSVGAHVGVTQPVDPHTALGWVPAAPLPERLVVIDAAGQHPVLAAHTNEGLLGLDLAGPALVERTALMTGMAYPMDRGGSGRTKPWYCSFMPYLDACK